MSLAQLVHCLQLSSILSFVRYIMQIEDARMQKGWDHGHWVYWPG